MPHLRDICWSCGGIYKNHRLGQCQSFEFIAPSSRNDSDILFCAPFQSDSSNKIYNVTSWRQKDFSCTCTGWRNHRTCKHIDQVKANPAKYKNKQATVINAGAGSVIGTVEALNDEMTAIEAAVKRGDPIEIAVLRAKVDYHRTMFETAGAGLSERLTQVQANIRQHVFGEEEKIAQPALKTKLTKAINSDDPFGD